MMDDDGAPAPECLELLLPHMADHDFVGPAVVAEQDESRLCFPIRLPGRTRVVHRMADVEAAAVDGLVADVVIPFNGVLVTRALVERIGLVREEFFIWGDDVEYLWRARRAGARVATVVARASGTRRRMTWARRSCSAARRTTTRRPTSSTTACAATTSPTSRSTSACTACSRSW
jgi:hypothetical protein